MGNLAPYVSVRRGRVHSTLPRRTQRKTRPCLILHPPSVNEPFLCLFAIYERFSQNSGQYLFFGRKSHDLIAGQHIGDTGVEFLEFLNGGIVVFGKIGKSDLCLADNVQLISNRG